MNSHASPARSCLAPRWFRAPTGRSARPLPNAFTLVELLVAVALAAMFSAALIGLLGNLSVSQRVLKEKYPLQPWGDLLLDQLRFDLAHAEGIYWKPDLLRLTGHLARDDASGQPRHLPAEVQYQVEPIGGRSWLVRSEIRPHEGRAGKSRRLFCADVTYVVVRVSPEDGGFDEVDPKPLPWWSDSLLAVRDEVELPLVTRYEIALSSLSGVTPLWTGVIDRR